MGCPGRVITAAAFRVSFIGVDMCRSFFLWSHRRLEHPAPLPFTEEDAACHKPMRSFFEPNL